MKTIEEKMGTVRHEPTKIDREFFENLSENADLLLAELLAACKAYESDVASRKKNLEAQAVAAKERIGQLSIGKNELTSSITNATSRTDLDTAAKLEAELDSIEKEISILERKVHLADSAELKGDPLLFTAAKKCADAVEENYAQRRAAYMECYRLLEPVIEDQKKLLDELLTKGSRRWHLNGDSQYKSVCAHFHEEEKKQAEAESSAGSLRERESHQHKNLETGSWIASGQD